MNTFMNGLIDVTNVAMTENGAVTHRTTKSAVLDLFSLCGAYRNRSEADCILAFKNAFDENQTLALKCLFYLRDCRGGQGERRFFRVCYHWFAQNYPEIARKYIECIPYYGRYDDIYCLFNTPLEQDALAFIKKEIDNGLEILGAIDELG